MKIAVIPEQKWKWFGHAGHFCAADSCRFHLCTQVGRYLISTVGDCYLNSASGERVTLGAGKDSFFETYVFRVQPGKRCIDSSCGCGQPNIDLCEIEGVRVATARKATAQHISACRRYANGTQKKTRVA